MTDLRGTLFKGGNAEPAPAAAPAGFDPLTAESAFRSYNRHRYDRLVAQVGERGAEGVSMLPLLLHLNQPGLPGYVESPTCPCGIADYSPSHLELALSRRLFPRSNPRRAGIRRPFVDVAAVMGSAGTIGFSGESDLDVWICYDEAAAPGGVELYERKVREVEAWLTAHTGLEVHLFCQATERIRSNDFGETDVAGCGSAMGALLKEEFYRTGIVLAGKTPSWWLVPSGAGPETYRAAVEELSRSPIFPAGGHVDLGWVPRVPLGELFGTAIWQIVKGWESPFKSSLKMGLLEKAILSKEPAPPLCDALKERVLRGEAPDPYRLLFDEVMCYYRGRGDAQTEDLLAQSFYLKAGVRLDPEALASETWSDDDEAVLRRYVSQWGWGSRRVRHLNEFGRWKFEWVQALTKDVDQFLLRTYKRIRAVLDQSRETQRITPRDLTLLGRKLQAIYRQVPHKVETLHFLRASVEEPTLSLYQETLPDGESPWRLYRGRVTPINVDESEGDFLRTAEEPLELLVWAARNRLLGSRTRVLSHGVERDVAAAELDTLGQTLATFAQESDGHAAPFETLLESPHLTRLLVVPNLGVDTEDVRELGVLYATTWDESFYRKWSGPDAFRAFVEEVFVPFLLQSSDPGAVTVFVPPRKVGSMRGPHRRLHRELPAVAAFLGGRSARPGVRRRYVGFAGPGCFVLDRPERTELRHRVFSDRDGLFRYLSAVGPYHSVETLVETHPGDLAILKAVVEASTPGVVDIFVLEEAGVETLIVVDEIGNFIHFPHRLEGEPYVLAKLLVFLENAFPETAAQHESPLAGRGFAGAVRIHTLLFDGTCRAFTATQEHLARVKNLGLHPTGLTIERTGTDGEGSSGYRITWGDQVIESTGDRSPLEELRERIRKARGSGLHYGVFVTRLFLDERFTAQHCGPFVATGHFLFYKKAIEQRLSS